MSCCRIAGYLGCSPSEVDDLPAQDFDLLVRFYEEEPWGAWRDNMHAAIIAREVRRIRWPRQRASLSTWLLEHPARRAAANVQDFKQLLVSMAGGICKHVSQAIRRPVRRRKKAHTT